MEYSLETLDLALDYLNNNKKITEIDTLGAMIQTESKQFINITESIDIVLNEKFDPKQIKETIKNAIKKVLDKIKDFIEWVKMKVLKLFSAIYLKLKNRKSLKQLYNEVKTKAAHESVEFVNEDAKFDLDHFINREVGIDEYYSPTKIIEIYDRFSKKIYSACFDWEGTNTPLITSSSFKEYMGNTVGYNIDNIFDPVSRDDICIKGFVENDWQSQAEKLSTSISKDFEDNLKWMKEKETELQKALVNIDKISDDEIKNSNSLADLISLSSKKDDEKEKIQDTLAKIAKAIEYQVQFINLAKRYLQKCNNIVEETEEFFLKMKKSVS